MQMKKISCVQVRMTRFEWIISAFGGCAFDEIISLPANVGCKNNGVTDKY